MLSDWVILYYVGENHCYIVRIVEEATSWPMSTS